jgi:class 3 adenylate cyclase
MSIVEDIKKDVKEILESKWEKRDGIVVPETDDIKLKNDAVCLKGTILYADLYDSTGLVNSYKDYFVAEIYKTYLVSACRLIRLNEGVVTAFDGDRVMAVFLGDSKNSNAAKTALNINYVVQDIINKLIKERYPNSGYQIQQSVGIDTSDIFVARTGIRGSNDLVWVGRSANYAAKLCSLRESNYVTYITENVFNALNEETKYSHEPKICMWEKYMWKDQGIIVYRSNWWWSPG